MTAGIAVPLADAVAQTRASIERNDADIMDVLDENRHVARGLDNLIGVVVARRDWRHAVVGDAAIPGGAVQPRISGVLRACTPLSP